MDTPTNMSRDGLDDVSLADVEASAPRPGALRKAGAVGAATTLAGGSALAMLTAFAAPAAAATFTVTQATDDGRGSVPGSLSWAIAQADADATADVIDFSPSLTTITFSGDADQVSITKALSIVGPGAGALTIDFDGNCGLVAVLDNDVALSVSGLTFVGGSAANCRSRNSNMGGALAVYGGGGVASLTITGVTFDNNYAYYYGGGMGCEGIITVLIADSTFTDNTSSAGAGGGLYLNCEQDATISGSFFSGNTAGDDGGGLAVSVAGGNLVTVVNSTFTGNTGGAGGASFENGTALVRNSTFYGNQGSFGGGLQGDVPVTIVQSTITGNTADDGGGIGWAQGYFFGASSYTNFTIIQSTVSGNTASSGVGNELSVRQVNATPQPSSIIGSIIAGTASGSAIDTIGAGASTDFPIEISSSLIGSVTDTSITDLGGNTFDVTDPLLEDLADNGGPTKTMLPAAGSPAIDAGPATVPDFEGNGFDQRGTPFVRVYNGRIDVGAVELQPEPEPTPPDPTPPDPDPVVPVFTG
ncbi:MAG: choice-of-anchor Q domain-containing protein [Acidimicrobiia bacterium]